MIRKSKVLMLTIALITVLNKPVFAAPTSGQAQNQQLQETRKLLKEVEEKRFKLDQEIEILDMHIEEALAQIDENNKQLETIKKESSLTDSNLKQLEKELKQEQELFEKRMRAMYISGVDSYLEILFDSKGLDDFISKISTIGNIIKYNKEITASVKLKQGDLNGIKLKLNEQNNKLLALNEETTTKLEQLEASKAKQKTLIEEARQQESLLTAQEASQESEELRLSQTALATENTPTERPSRGGTVKEETPEIEVPSSASSNAVIAYASKFLGTPYLWGGTTPSGFDCSGFTQYVYRHFGVSLGRTTKNQIKDGVAVSRDKLQPGDLVFYGKNGIPSHMGIYIGNGKYIHAPQTGDVVKISSYTRKDYITARRVLN